jgi:hypothetical protein
MTLTAHLELNNETKETLLKDIRRNISYTVGHSIANEYAKQIESIIQSDIVSTTTLIKEALTTMNGNSFVDELRAELQSALVKRSAQLASGLIDTAFDKLKREPLFNEKLKIKVHEVVTEYLKEHKL